MLSPVAIRSLLACALWLLALSGCTSRTVPLPPPTIERISSPTQEGFVTVSGVADDRASVAVLNEETMQGVIVPVDEANCEGSCAFEAQLQAEVGDSLLVWQFTETDNAIWGSVPD